MRLKIKKSKTKIEDKELRNGVAVQNLLPGPAPDLPLMGLLQWGSAEL